MLDRDNNGKNAIDIYVDLIQHIVQARKGALPLVTLRMGLRTVRREYPKLLFITIDKRFKIISMMPDNEESLLAAKAYLDELYKFLCQLVDKDTAKYILVDPSLEFLSKNIELTSTTRILDYLPSYMTEDVTKFLDAKRSSMEVHGKKENMIKTMNKWEEEGYSVDPLRYYLDKDQDTLKVVFDRFEEAVFWIQELKIELDEIDSEDYQEEIEQILLKMKDTTKIREIITDISRLKNKKSNKGG